MKIIVIGQMGSGKSTLTRKISDKFNVPRLELDRVWFEAGGHECLVNGCTEQEKQLVDEKKRQKISDFLSSNTNWVVDGTHSLINTVVATEAETIILIERPIVNRLFSHILRVLKGKNRHPETSFWQDIVHTKTIFKRWMQKRHLIQKESTRPFSEKLIVLTSFKEIDNYFDSLA